MKALVRPCTLLFLALLGSCNSAVSTDIVERVVEVNPNQQSDRVMIRVSNRGTQTLHSATIHFYGPGTVPNREVSQKENYGTLEPGKTSPYREIGSSYKYAPLEAVVEGAQIREGVSDFVGEAKIPNGNYRYELTYGPVEWDTVSSRLNGQLIYEQTELDTEISNILNEEISAAIAQEYYPSEVLWFNCFHQRTHQGIGQNESVIAYAKVFCTEPASKAQPSQKMGSLSPIPIRIELTQENDSFVVLSYQFPNQNSQSKQALAAIFSPEAIEEIKTARIEESTYKRIELLLGTTDRIAAIRND